jgi:hypothetical protein
LLELDGDQLLEFLDDDLADEFGQLWAAGLDERRDSLLEVRRLCGLGHTAIFAFDRAGRLRLPIHDHALRGSSAPGA